MRLQKYEVDAIKKAVHRHFGASSRVFLFGSRVDDTKAGGDIDILVEHDGSMEGSKLIRAKLHTMTDIQFALGDRKIDIVVLSGKSEKTPLIEEEARKEGVEL
ncbi:MAG: nucleotidyltransferase family protein [Spirochaetaceae bacterium]